MHETNNFVETVRNRPVGFSKYDGKSRRTLEKSPVFGGSVPLAEGEGAAQSPLMPSSTHRSL